MLMIFLSKQALIQKKIGLQLFNFFVNIKILNFSYEDKNISVENNKKKEIDNDEKYFDNFEF